MVTKGARLTAAPRARRGVARVSGSAEGRLSIRVRSRELVLVVSESSSCSGSRVL